MQMVRHSVPGLFKVEQRRELADYLRPGSTQHHSDHSVLTNVLLVAQNAVQVTPRTQLQRGEAGFDCGHFNWSCAEWHDIWPGMRGCGMALQHVHAYNVYTPSIQVAQMIANMNSERTHFKAQLATTLRRMK